MANSELTCRSRHIASLLAMLMCAAFVDWTTCANSAAGDLVYTPINPSFGGNPFNSSHLMGLANAQNEPKRRADEAKSQRSSLTSTERFLQMLQARLYSSLAQQVSEAIFGENAQQNGTITFQDQQVAFVNTGTEIQLTITDFTTGEVTQIIVPTLVTTQ
jgi:curli production assembly/transport component CsgF